jgi:hypothetical protein
MSLYFYFLICTFFILSAIEFDSSTHQYRPDNRITSIAYDTKHSMLLTGTNRLQLWPFKLVVKATNKTHDAPLCAALYNSSFGQVCMDRILSSLS